MPIDFSKIKAKKKEPNPIDPIQIFQKLKVKDPDINDLWLAQGDALREWHSSRDKFDVGIVLNTGAGKTLVGLLIAQSLVNETQGRVVYACSSIQLVEQTAEKGKNYGIPSTTYFRNEFSNDLYKECKAPCLTTYHAIFNGKSKFVSENISALIFDDAHTAENLLRDQFSLRIDRNSHESLYNSVVGLFEDYHKEIGKAGSYHELGDSRCRRIFLVPPFIIHTHSSELLRLFIKYKLSNTSDTKFAWEHLKDSIDLCCLLITGSEITLTPPFVPVRHLNYFDNRKRRVYLSATLSSTDSFTRTFGAKPEQIIAPETTAGECERLIVVPSKLDGGDHDLSKAKGILKSYKTLIMVPSYASANEWEDFADLPDTKDVTSELNDFKKSTKNPKIILTARYDGIDLPGDTCRCMVIDGLPMGVGLLEKFLWEYLNLSNTLRTAIVSRIVQSFGRISRGMSDHGVVMLSGSDLIEWVLTPANLKEFPVFLQKQISLGVELSKQATSKKDILDAIKACLGRNDDWIESYSQYMQDIEIEKAEGDTELLTILAQSESSFAVNIWQRNYHDAIKALSDTLEDAFKLSASTGAWHCLWLGRALQLAGDEDRAIELFTRSHAVLKNIPPLPREHGSKLEVPHQVKEVALQFISDKDSKVSIPKNVKKDIRYLDGTGSSGQTEESLRSFGQYIGLDSSRPDKEHRTGPDVLWLDNNEVAYCMDVKSDKKKTSKYTKEEIGQLADHMQWVKNNTSAKSIIPILVGPIIKASASSNPPNNILVIDLEQFNSAAKKLIAAFEDISREAIPLSLEQVTSEVFSKRHLLWDKCFSDLKKYILKNI